MRISYTCIPKPELEEIDPARERRVRPLRRSDPLVWEGNQLEEDEARLCRP
jgi:hypothetical protein